jgi:hypothetical protein
MTETEWHACTDPKLMLGLLLRGKNTSDRKFRLFACACCRRIWDRFPDPCNRDLVAAVEEHPDGGFYDPDLEPALIASSWREQDFLAEPAYWVAKYLGRGFYKWSASAAALGVVLKVMSVHGQGPGREAELDVQAALLRDIVGPLPFRPVAIDPTVLAWQDATVVRLAQAAYEQRSLPVGTLELDRLAVLADALEEAGCQDQEVLEHLREPGGVHVRGCYVVDLLLGKS